MRRVRNSVAGSLGGLFAWGVTLGEIFGGSPFSFGNNMNRYFESTR